MLLFAMVLACAECTSRGGSGDATSTLCNYTWLFRVPSNDTLPLNQPTTEYCIDNSGSRDMGFNQLFDFIGRNRSSATLSAMMAGSSMLPMYYEVMLKVPLRAHLATHTLDGMSEWLRVCLCV